MAIEQLNSQLADNQPDYLNTEIQVLLTGHMIKGALMSVLDKENPHSDLVADAILGRMFNNHDMQGIGSLLTATMGVKTEININIGENYRCDKKVYRKNDRSEIGVCKVIAINKFADYDRQVKVEYSYEALQSKEGESITTTETEWVSVKSLSK